MTVAIWMASCCSNIEKHLERYALSVPWLAMIRYRPFATSTSTGCSEHRSKAIVNTHQSYHHKLPFRYIKFQNSAKFGFHAFLLHADGLQDMDQSPANRRRQGQAYFERRIPAHTRYRGRRINDMFSQTCLRTGVDVQAQKMMLLRHAPGTT